MTGMFICLVNLTGLTLTWMRITPIQTTRSPSKRRNSGNTSRSLKKTTCLKWTCSKTGRRLWKRWRKKPMMHSKPNEARLLSSIITSSSWLNLCMEGRTVLRTTPICLSTRISSQLTRLQELEETSQRAQLLRSVKPPRLSLTLLALTLSEWLLEPSVAAEVSSRLLSTSTWSVLVETARRLKESTILSWILLTKRVTSKRMA